MHRGMELLSEGAKRVDPDRANGTINDAAGRAKRQAGEWTGDTSAQIEGLVQEVKDKAQKTWGAVRDAVRALRDEVRKEEERSDADAG